MEDKIVVSIHQTVADKFIQVLDNIGIRHMDMACHDPSYGYDRYEISQNDYNLLKLTGSILISSEFHGDQCILAFNIELV